MNLILPWVKAFKLIVLLLTLPDAILYARFQVNEILVGSGAYLLRGREVGHITLHLTYTIPPRTKRTFLIVPVPPPPY